MNEYARFPAILRGNKGRTTAETLAFIALAISFLAGCASGPRATERAGTKPVYLTNSAVYTFLNPSAVEKTMDTLQRLEGSYGDDDFSFLIYVKADRKSTELLILNDFASEIARITYAPEGLKATGLIARAGLPAEYILADFQLSYYDAKMLRESLGRIGLSFTELAEGQTLVREIRDGDKLIISIVKSGGDLAFRNLLRGYAYKVRNGE